MLPWELVVTLIIFALIFILYVWHRVIKRNLSIKYALLWLVFCIAMVIAILIPDVLKIICDFIGINTVSNFIFLIGFGILLFITFVLTEIVSTQKNKITALAQEIAIMKHEEKRDAKFKKKKKKI